MYVHFYIYNIYVCTYVLVISCPGVLQQKYSADCPRVKPEVCPRVKPEVTSTVTPGQDITNLYPGNHSLLTVGVYSLI